MTAEPRLSSCAALLRAHLLDRQFEEVVRGRVWHRPCDAEGTVVHVVDRQVSSLDGTFTVNWGVLVPATHDILAWYRLPPKFEAGHGTLTGRLSSLPPGTFGADAWWPNSRTGEGSGAALIDLADRLELHLTPFLAMAVSSEQVLQCVERGLADSWWLRRTSPYGDDKFYLRWCALLIAVEHPPEDVQRVVDIAKRRQPTNATLLKKLEVLSRSYS